MGSAESEVAVAVVSSAHKSKQPILAYKRHLNEDVRY